MYESNDQMVSHPSHYMSDSGLETIDVIEAFTKDLTGIEAYDTGNVIKYICRWKNKGGVQDLEKAMWYIQHLIDHEDSMIRFEELRNKLDDEFGGPIFEPGDYEVSYCDGNVSFRKKEEK